MYTKNKFIPFFKILKDENPKEPVLTWNNAWYYQGESLYSILLKILVANSCDLKEMQSIFFPQNYLKNLHQSKCFLLGDLEYINVTRLTGISREALENSTFLPVLKNILGMNEISFTSYKKYIREIMNVFCDNSFYYCPKCIKAGKHFTYFQSKSVTTCLIHKVLLVNVCPKCKHRLSYDLLWWSKAKNEYLKRSFWNSPTSWINLCPYCFSELSKQRCEKENSIQISKAFAWMLHNTKMTTKGISVSNREPSITQRCRTIKQINENNIKYQLNFLYKFNNSSISPSNYVDDIFISNIYWDIYRAIARQIRWQFGKQDKEQLGRIFHNLWIPSILPRTNVISYILFRTIIERCYSFSDIGRKRNINAYDPDIGSTVPDNISITYVFILKGLYDSNLINYSTFVWAISNILGIAFMELYRRCQKYVEDQGDQTNYLIRNNFTEEYGQPLYVFTKCERNYCNTLMVYIPKGSGEDLDKMYKLQ